MFIRLVMIVLLFMPTALAAQSTVAPTFPLTENAGYPQGFNPRQLPVVQPRYQIPTNRIKNMVGQAIEKACLRGGRATQICGAAAMVGGGVGVSRLLGASWDHIGTVVGGAASGAASGALLNCATGAAVGAFFGGVGAVPGCMAGALEGAILGGFIGAGGSAYSLSKDGSNVVTNGNLGAGGATGTQAVAQPLIEVQYYTDPQAQQLKAQGYPLNTTFPCHTQSTYHGCMLMNSTMDIQANNPDYSVCHTDGGKVVNGCRGPKFMNPMTLKASSDSGYDPAGWLRDKAAIGCTDTCWTGGYGSYFSDTVNVPHTSLYVSDASYPDESSVPKIKYVPVAPTPVYAIGYNAGTSTDDLSKSTKEDVLAAVANAAWQASGTESGDGAFTSANPVTVDDVAQVNPNLQGGPIVNGDFIRPVADLNSPGGTLAHPIQEPTQTAAVPTVPGTYGNPNTTTSPGSTPAAPDTDLDISSGGALGDPLQPIKDFIAGPLAPFLNPHFSVPASGCPIFGIDLRTIARKFMPIGGAYGEVGVSAVEMFNYDSTAMCKVMEDHRTEVQGVLTIILTMLTFMWFFKRND